MKLVSLYAGVGGLDRGFLESGCELLLANDFSEAAVATYRLNDPANEDKVVLGDVKQVLIDYGPRLRDSGVDLLLAGFPCPSWSMAGHRKGFEDGVRGQEFFTVLSFLTMHRPSYFYLENVRGLLSHDGGRSFEFMRQALSNLGYNVSHRLYEATEFGVPQRRKRVIVAGNCVGRDAAEMLPNPVAPPDENLHLGRVLEAVRAACGEPRSEHVFNHNLHNPIRKSHWIALLKEGENLAKLSEVEIRAREAVMGLDPVQIPTSYMDYRRLNRSEIAPTMMFGNTSLPIHPTEHRNLSVREAAAVQSFPMDFVFCGGISDQYKQVGNAVAPLMSKGLSDAFELFLASDRGEPSRCELAVYEPDLKAPEFLSQFVPVDQTNVEAPLGGSFSGAGSEPTVCDE